MSSRFNSYFTALLVCALFLSFPATSMAGKLDDMLTHARNCGVSSEAVEQIQGLASGGSAEAEASAVLSPLLNACVEQLPTTPLETKLSEGVAKRVPPRVIAGALEKKLAGFRFAREVLLTTTGSLDATALEIVGNGVGKGVPRSDFEEFASDFGKQKPEVFLTGLTMVSLQGQAGYDFGLTRKILKKGVESGNLTPDWQYLVRVVLTARKQGIADAAVAAAAVAVLEKGGHVSSILPELGFTGRDLGASDTK